MCRNTVSVQKYKVYVQIYSMSAMYVSAHELITSRCENRDEAEKETQWCCEEGKAAAAPLLMVAFHGTDDWLEFVVPNVFFCFRNGQR